MTFKKNTINTDHNHQNDWLEHDFSEGQLSIDVYETEKEIIIKSTIAGVKPEDLNISLNNDMLTIKGKRELTLPKNVTEDGFLYRECYWGGFSRSLVLPTEIDESNIDAILEDGVLTVTLIKLSKPERIEVKIK